MLESFWWRYPGTENSLLAIKKVIRFAEWGDIWRIIQGKIFKTREIRMYSTNIGERIGWGSGDFLHTGFLILTHTHIYTYTLIQTHANACVCVREKEKERVCVYS